MPSCSETEALPRTGGGSAVTLISGIYAAAQQCGMGGLASLEVHQIVLGLSGTGPQTVFGARQPQLGQVGEIDRQSGVERLLLGKKCFGGLPVAPVKRRRVPCCGGVAILSRRRHIHFSRNQRNIGDTRAERS